MAALILLGLAAWLWFNKSDTRATAIPLAPGAETQDDGVLGTKVVVKKFDLEQKRVGGQPYYTTGKDVIWLQYAPYDSRAFVEVLNPQSPQRLNQGVYGQSDDGRYFAYARIKSGANIHYLYEFLILGLAQLPDMQKVWIITNPNQGKPLTGYLEAGVFVEAGALYPTEIIYPKEYF